MTERSEVLGDVDFAPAKAAKPASRWRNRYKVCAKGGARIGETEWPAGTEQWGQTIFPSAEMAEHHALRFVSSPKWTPALDVGDILHLGAFPVEGDA